MAHAHNTEIIDDFEEFYRTYYRDEVEKLAQGYPNEQRSLYIDWRDLYTYDQDMAEDYRAKPGQMQDFAEEALRMFDLPVDVSLGQAHVRMTGLPEATRIDDLVSRHRGALVAIEGIITDCSDVDPAIREAAFECQRCGTLTRIPQYSDVLEEPHECQGCERNGPFKINLQQSEFVDKQSGRIQQLPTGDEPTTDGIRLSLTDDIAGSLSERDIVRLTGVIQFEQMKDSPRFDITMDVQVVETHRDEETPLSEWTDYLDIETSNNVTLEEELNSFVSRSVQILAEGGELDEANTKAKIITPFIACLGWNVYDNKEVLLEYPGNDSDVDERADYALFGPNESPSVLIEAKRPKVPLSSVEKEIKGYMRLFGGDWGLLTNGKRYQLYRIVPGKDSPEEELVISCDLEELPNQDLLNSITRAGVYELE